MVNTDDICAVRPDLCSGASIRHKKRKKKTAVKKRHQMQDTLGDFWEREADGLERTPPPPADLERKPTSRSGLAAPQGPSPARQQISFEYYMNANSNHAAIGGRYAGRQDAFQQVLRPAVITGPSPVPQANEAPAQEAPAGPPAPPADSSAGPK